MDILFVTLVEFFIGTCQNGFNNFFGDFSSQGKLIKEEDKRMSNDIKFILFLN